MRSNLLALFVMVLTVGCSTVGGGAASVDAGADPDGAPATSPDGGSAADGGSPSCERYLACLLVTTPEAYGAAIQVYGEGAACWKTPQQAEGCGQACESAFSRISYQCECTETQCTKCDELPARIYDSWEPDRRMKCDDGSSLGAQEIRLSFEPGPGRTTVANLQFRDLSVWSAPPLEGTAACSGPFSVTGAKTQGAYSEIWDVVLTPMNGGKSFGIVVTKKTTFTGGHETTCTLSATQTSS